MLLEIYKAGKMRPKSWTVASHARVVSLPTGDLHIFVKSHKVQKAELENTYYKEEQTFTIEAARLLKSRQLPANLHLG